MHPLRTCLFSSHQKCLGRLACFVDHGLGFRKKSKCENIIIPSPTKGGRPVISLFRTCIEFSTNFHEISMEVGGSRLTSKNSMEVSGSGSFHCFYPLQLPRIYSVEASMSVHIPLPYILPPISQTSSSLHKTNPNPNPKLELPPWKLAYFQRPWR